VFDWYIDILDLFILYLIDGIIFIIKHNIISCL